MLVIVAVFKVKSCPALLGKRNKEGRSSQQYAAGRLAGWYLALSTSLVYSVSNIRVFHWIDNWMIDVRRSPTFHGQTGQSDKLASNMTLL